jgi:Na+-transporting methylmalonyl-CoA/oxaloacetate decarboxylase gamma subunit
MSEAVEVTLVGMLFVFGAILLLWGMMVLVMRFTEEKAASPEAEIPVQEDSNEQRKRAAAAAVAVMLALQDTSPKPFPTPPPALVSAWQVVQRSNQLKDRGFKR